MKKPFKVISHNIEKGGGKISDLEKYSKYEQVPNNITPKEFRLYYIANEITRQDADLIVLQEFQDNIKGEYIIRRLKDCGISNFIISPNIDTRSGGGILIASKYMLEKDRVFDDFRLLAVKISELNTFCLGYHLLDRGSESPFILLEYARYRKDDKTILAGDSNAWKLGESTGKTLSMNSKRITNLEKLEYRDVTRKFIAKNQQREHTFINQKGDKFPIDRIDVSKTLFNDVVSCNISNNNIINGNSDHESVSIIVNL